ncbi:MerR family transcriptional regulator [Pseudoalteromonas sp. N1230-9]|uniref:MerR family transcriptional regulator n=1 Tax=Pseudoalteromonas sp. N1230-9 TaxID=2907156 RepID=UPI002B282F3F|nr:MerR family transcriptional regulator [Pseudoalteromonas sp. N1230-9]
MKTKQVTQLTGLTKDTIRFYEKEQLIPPPSRDVNGYRIYSEKTVEQLNMITMAKNLGFTLKEIKELTQLLGKNNLTQQAMAAKLIEKSKEIDAKIAELTNIKALIDHALKGMCEYKDKLS